MNILTPIEIIHQTYGHVKDQAHGVKHIIDVLNNMYEINNKLQLGINYSELFAAALFHDITSETDRENHHISGAEAARKELVGVLEPEAIERVAKAIEDHRASSGNLPNELDLSGVLYAADKGNTKDIGTKLARSYDYNVAKGLGYDEATKNAVSHVKEKYLEGGYLKKNTVMILMGW